MVIGRASAALKKPRHRIGRAVVAGRTDRQDGEDSVGRAQELRFPSLRAFGDDWAERWARSVRRLGYSVVGREMGLTTESVRKRVLKDPRA
jgi:hypothetical protein